MAAQSLINAGARVSALRSQPLFNSRLGPSWLYALVIFLNAFLLFQVQPLIGKIILPWFGGAAAVWTVCLLFFQVALLLGYLYAHVLTRSAAPCMQCRIHIGLLALSLLVLPILPRETWKPTGSGDPSWRILLLLTLTVGLPYFLLSSTSPLLQSWYARSRAGAVPYRFYALSNMGSMLALVSYPALIEPKLTSTHQAMLWSAAYVLSAVVCSCVALGTRLNSPNAPAGTEVPPVSDAAPHSPFSDKLMWIALAACGSALLVAITTHVTQNVASVPLLWVIPLALYLLSFILCFDGSFWYRRGLYLRLLAVALACMAYALSPAFAVLPLGLLVGLYCCGLFVCCMFCHGELVRLKPHPARLTTFYLLISFGSALGAFFAALLAPRIFAGQFELQIALGFCALLVPIVYHRDPKSRLYRARWQPAWIALVGLTLVLVAGLISTAVEQSARARVMVRNFYGVLSVVDQSGPSVKMNAAAAEGDSERSRKLMNGSIDHGMQWLTPSRRTEPTAYYAADSGIGIALRAAGEQRAALRVGVMGLGVGTLACYGRPEDHYTFYEINPLVARLAGAEFSYIRDSAAQVEIVLGDGRLSLEREPSRQYDLLAVDAFSGDSIPVHMLTRQAFALYFEHLQPAGVLAVHISNQYLNLKPVVQAAATALHKQAVVIDNPGDRVHGVFRSTWVLLGNGDGYLGQQEIESAGQRLPRAPGRLWTDDYSSLFSILD